MPFKNVLFKWTGFKLCLKTFSYYFDCFNINESELQLSIHL